ncbi:MAG: hypothetical protein FWC55_08805 [Firmicutes bacterium]|nr:hypothetical protein [Bacillota bacterium]
MAEWSSFFNSLDGDRRYTAAQFVEYFASFIGNGVFWGGNYLKVDALTGMDVQVGVGKGFINGYYYSNQDTAKRTTLGPAHATLPRVDRVVLRLDLSQSGRAITAVVKPGTPAASPAAPGLQRDNAAWELGLADIRVNAGAVSVVQSNITDLRLSSQYCGVVAGLINQPDLNGIFNQYQAKFNEVTTGWDTWFTAAKADYPSWKSAKDAEWTALKTAFQGWFDQVKADLYAQSNTDFEDWSRRAGYKKTVTFAPDGNISESITNVSNASTLATRTTTFNADGSITEKVTWSDPALTATKVTAIGTNTVTETYS